MGEENSDATNLDLYVDQSLEPAAGSRAIEALLRTNEGVRLREQQRWGWYPYLPHEVFHTHPHERHSNLGQLNPSLINFRNGSASQAEEGKVVAETSRGSFECNICLELAKDPVVTSCGHLFCWPCIFQWLDKHSIHKECPVCKGMIFLENIIPIYGRGNNAHVTDPTVPPRPKARRMSLGQNLQINASALPGEETLQLHGNISGLIQHLVQPHEPDNARQEQAGVTTSLLRSSRTPRGISNEQNHVATRHDLLAPMLNHIGRGYRNLERPSSADGGGSFSSIGAYITENEANSSLERNSMASLSASTSRRVRGRTMAYSGMDWQRPRPPQEF